jgi:hypothetical protein
VYSAFPGGTPDYESKTYRYSYQSFVTPPSVFDYDSETGQSKLLKRQEVLGGYDPAQYVSERLWATARDGVKVPVSMVYKKGFERDGKGPLLLYGYGSYGFGTPVTFSSSRLSLLDRGMAYAIAHIRGGDEMGEQWRLDGMLMKKKNTFFDFIDSAEYLIEERWTSKDRLEIEGGGQFPPGLVSRGASGGAFRGCDEHHDGRLAPADGGRVPGVGQSQREGSVRLHEDVQPLRQSREAGVSGDAGDDQFERQPSDVLGAGEIRGAAARAEDGSKPAAAENQDGSGRPWRGLWAVRPAQGPGV